MRGEKGSKLIGEGGGDDGANDLAIGGSDANGAELGGVFGVFVEDEETVGAEMNIDRGWNRVGKDEVADLKEGGEVGGGDGVIVVSGFGIVKCVGFQNVGVIREGTVDSAALEASKGLAGGEGCW